MSNHENQDLGHWVSKAGPRPELAIGFIYLITNLSNGRAYIGKKSMVSKVTKPPLKGKKLKRRSVKESDWRHYTSSGWELQRDMNTSKVWSEAAGSDFKFEIIRWCYSKWEMGYFEAKMQFDEGVLMNPEKWYNGIINCRLGTAPKGYKH